MLELRNNINTRSVNYILLNASFSDRIGMIDGKAAAILYMYANKKKEDAHWIDTISFSLLEEALSQINIYTPLTFGNGIAGLGTLIEYLSQEDLLEVNTNEILEEIEPYLLSAVYGAKLKEINISNGISGIGIYFLRRLSARTPATDFQVMRYKESIIACVDQIALAVESHETWQLPDFTIYDGISGVLLFLRKAQHLDIYGPKITELLNKLSGNLFTYLNTIPFRWDLIHAWFCLFYCNSDNANPFITDAVETSFNKFIREGACQFDEVDFYDAAIISMYLRLIFIRFKKDGSIEELSIRLQEHTEGILCHNSLKSLFPYHKAYRAVPIGLQKGLCGVMLPLLSLQTNNYDWLNIINISF